MEEMNVNVKNSASIGNICSQTMNNKARNSQVEMFIEQQVEDDQEVKSILMDKLQKSCL
jgi:hypothetical protein